MIDVNMAFKAAFSVVLVLAAWSDMRRFRIPNVYPAIIAALFVAAWFSGFAFAAPLWSHGAHFAIALVAGMMLFRFGWFGGGDAKLYAAIALWFALGQAWLLLLVTTLVGALIVVVRMLWHIARTWFGSGEASRTRLFDRKIAYGLAIAAGGIAAIFRVYP